MWESLKPIPSFLCSRASVLDSSASFSGPDRIRGNGFRAQVQRLCASGASHVESPIVQKSSESHFCSFSALAQCVI